MASQGTAASSRRRRAVPAGQPSIWRSEMARAKTSGAKAGAIVSAAKAPTPRLSRRHPAAGTPAPPAARHRSPTARARRSWRRAPPCGRCRSGSTSRRSRRRGERSHRSGFRAARAIEEDNVGLETGVFREPERRLGSDFDLIERRAVPAPEQCDLQNLVTIALRRATSVVPTPATSSWFDENALIWLRMSMAVRAGWKPAALLRLREGHS